MAVDEEERGRTLTPAEQVRLERYEQVSARLAALGYQRHELTIGIMRANVLTLMLGVPFALGSHAAFLVASGSDGVRRGLLDHVLALPLALIVLVVVHELIHGAVWGLFSEHRWRDIEFGFMREYLTPYCTATSPLPKGGYVLGALMPMLVLGLVPLAVAIATGDLGLFVVGLVMTLAGGGDLLVVIELLRYRSDARELLIYDHPTQAGAVVFER